MFLILSFPSLGCTKNGLVSHIIQMTDLLYIDVVQQLEVALLGMLMVQVINILASRLASSPWLDTPSQPHPKMYISTSPSPHPQSVPIMGKSSTIPKPTVASTSAAPQAMAPTALEGTDPEVSQHCKIIPTPLEPSSTNTKWSLEIPPMVVVQELLILTEANPECLNRPGGGKDYLCHLCQLRHSNLDMILMHIRKHLEVVVGCPVCGKGYQNAGSLCKHSKEVHHIQIVASASSVSIENSS